MICNKDFIIHFFKKNFISIFIARMPIIIHVDGVVGAGKTTLCSKFKHYRNVTVVDTDSVLHQAYENSMKYKLPKRFEKLEKEKKRIMNDVIKNTKTKYLLFCGLTLNISMADYKYFIKITDPIETYKR